MQPATLKNIARDPQGRSVAALARSYRRGTLPRSFMGGDPNTIAFLVAAGMSQTDANFIADYDPVDKPTLIGLIQGGMAPYDALTKIYGAPYQPNVDKPPLPGYKPPVYAPLPGYPMMTSGATVAPMPATVGGISIPATVFGIPTLYVALGGAAAIFLAMREMG